MMDKIVLVVEDSADIRIMVSRLITREGCQVIQAENGLDAVRLAHRYRPALIVMDINLPGIDGLEVARQLRADPALDEVPIVAMTAYAVAITTTIARRVGIQRVIFKPFDIDTLMVEVRAFLATALLVQPEML